MSRDMWNRRYAEVEFAYGTEPNGFLVEVAARIPAGPVLVLGAGQGRNAVHLALLGYEVTALDQSGVGLARAHELAAACGVRLRTVVADVGAWAIDEQAWAGIVAIFFHLPPPLRRRVHRQSAAALQPGGVFVLEAFAPGQLALGTGGPPAAELLYDVATLREDLAGLEVDHAVELERELHEGRYHHGRSRVVQIVARRPRREG